MDVHDGAHRVELLLHRINESDEIPARSKKLIQHFWEQCNADGLKPGGVYKYLHALRYLAMWLPKPLDRATRRDIIKFVGEVERRDWTYWTKHGAKVALKKFFKWLRHTDLYPEEVQWIVTTARDMKHKLPEELLSEEEVKSLIQHANNPRDKALVAVLYESGARIGELLGLKCKHVTFDQYGAVIVVNGKSGDRRVRLVASAPLLTACLASHATKNPEDSVWLTRFNKMNGDGLSPLGYAGACKIVSELAKRAGVKKRVHPHLFRHSRATALANKLTEAQLKEMFGWTQGSTMASIYIHLSGRDVDNALLEIAGLSAPKKPGEKFKVKICPRCEEKNSPDSLYCTRCAFPLDQRALDWADDKMDDLLKMPQVRKVLRELIQSQLAKRVA